MDYVEGARKLFQFLGFFIVGLGGTYWYMKDKAIITSGPGSTFGLYFKYFIVFALLGGLLGSLIGTLIGHGIGLVVEYWYVVAIVIGIGVLALKKSKTVDSDDDD